MGTLGIFHPNWLIFLLRTFSGQNQTEAWQLKQFFYPAV
jgi:hypothetical protein